MDASGQLVAGRTEATLGGEAAGRATTALAQRQAREEEAKLLKLQQRAMLSHDGLLLSGPRGTRFEVRGFCPGVCCVVMLEFSLSSLSFEFI